jgi:hypothetical protein
MRIGYYAFYHILVVSDVDLINDGSEGIIQQLNNFLGRVFIIFDEGMIPFTFLGASSHQSSRCSISDTNTMHTGILNVATNDIDDLLSVGNVAICQQKDLFWIARDQWIFEGCLEGSLDLGASEVCRPFVDLFYSEFDCIVVVGKR